MTKKGKIKMSKKKFDFGGYATKNDLKCSDGRVIRHGAFKDNDGKKVPLVWQHGQSEPTNILGHAVLENRSDGVYAYGYLNETENAMHARSAIEHGDIDSLSIYASDLEEHNKNVLHGDIKEVSLVISGANSGAKIDNIAFAHSDGNVDIDDTEAIIKGGFYIEDGELQHANDNGTEDDGDESGDRTAKEVFDSMTEEQQAVVYAMIGEALDESPDEADEDDDVEHGEEGTKNFQHSNKGEKGMKKNLFDKGTIKEKDDEFVIMHSDMQKILESAKECGSFKKAFLAHADSYGITNIDYLFPDSKTIDNTPEFIKRRTEWVNEVLSSVHKTPFSRVKTVQADITADEARAKGYVKASLKKEEIIKLLKRETLPKTVYKKQKLDRDDIIDIKDFDVVVWLKAEMRLMLDEEIARAMLISDGREVGDADKINEDNIRPIYKDDEMYAHRVILPANSTPDAMAEAILRSMSVYEGSGSPTMFASPDTIIDMLLVKDTIGRRLYSTEAELMAALGVSKIVRVPLFKGVQREDSGTKYDLNAIIVNLRDYNAGTDRGGEVTLFDDFDIDYNQEKYLIETRLSGALTKVKSAIVVETTVAAG